MSVAKPGRIERQRPRRAKILGAAASSLAVVAGTVALTAANSSAAPVATRRTVVQSIRVPNYGLVIGNSRRSSLYLLTNEVHAKLHCTGACLSFWPPLYVRRGERITSAPGVKGRFGTVARGSREQVTFNSYPLYTFAGDRNQPAQSKGEGVVFGRGAIWYLVRASAQTPAATAVKHKTSGGTPTTTTPGGGYGY
ncbi:MAG: COG4315 family predicted lipoprotein [Acidimicrobiales bacterium]